jgi:hypothetical protein
VRDPTHATLTPRSRAPRTVEARTCGPPLRRMEVQD